MIFTLEQLKKHISYSTSRILDFYLCMDIDYDKKVLYLFVTNTKIPKAFDCEPYHSPDRKLTRLMIIEDILIEAKVHRENGYCVIVQGKPLIASIEELSNWIDIIRKEINDLENKFKRR